MNIKSKKNTQNNYKDSNSCLENKYEDHPMIINQVQDPKALSRVETAHCEDILTPKSRIKPLKTTKSYNSNTCKKK